LARAAAVVRTRRMNLYRHCFMILINRHAVATWRNRRTPRSVRRR
jgi:hypothetical protein